MKIGRYIIGLLSGLTFGMLFAPKKGAELRDDLKKELFKKEPKECCEGSLKVLGGAFKGAGEEAWDELKNLSESDQVSAFLALSQDKMRKFLDSAKEKGVNAAADMQDKLEKLTAIAREKAEDFKEKAVTAKSGMVKKAEKVKKTAVKKVKNIRKKISK